MTRRYDLDWIRVCAFALLVLYHVGMYYVTWDWHVKSPVASATIEPLMLLTSPWRLSLLFLVSGAATAFLLEKSRTGFLQTRSWRLLVPLVFGMLVIVPPQAYYQVVENLPGGFTDGYLSFWARYLQGDDSFCRDGECLDIPTWNHLWFVAYLWVYTLLIWGAARFMPRQLNRLRRSTLKLLSGAGIMLVPILFLMAARIGLWPTFDSTHGLFDDWYNHAQYFGVFLFGFLIANAQPAWQGIQRVRWTAFLIALASYAFFVWYFTLYTDTNPPPDGMLTLQRCVWSVFQWCSIVAILGFARQLAPGDGPALRYLSQAIFPVYILHQSVIVIAAHNMKLFEIDPVLEGLLLVALTFSVCFGCYEIIRRVGWLRPLFGLKNHRVAPRLAKTQLRMQ